MIGFWQWVRRKIRDSEILIDLKEQHRLGRVDSPIRDARYFGDDPIRISLHRAVDGWVVQYTQPPQRTQHSGRSHDDEPEVTLHLITEQQDLGNRIAHIITYEMLKR